MSKQSSISQSQFSKEIEAMYIVSEQTKTMQISYRKKIYKIW